MPIAEHGANKVQSSLGWPLNFSFQKKGKWGIIESGLTETGSLMDCSLKAGSQCGSHGGGSGGGGKGTRMKKNVKRIGHVLLIRQNQLCQG